MYVHPRQDSREWFQELRAESPYHSYQDYVQHRLAAALASPKLQPQSVIQKVAVDGGDVFINRDMAFPSSNDFLNRIDQLTSLQSGWVQGHFKNPNPTAVSWVMDVKFWHHDVLAVLQEILENKELADKCQWGPVKQYNSDEERLYTDMYTGD